MARLSLGDRCKVVSKDSCPVFYGWVGTANRFIGGETEVLFDDGSRGRFKSYELRNVSKRGMGT